MSTDSSVPGQATAVAEEGRFTFRSASKEVVALVIAGVTLANLLYWAGAFYLNGWYSEIGVDPSLFPRDDSGMVFAGTAAYVHGVVRVLGSISPALVETWQVAWIAVGALFGILLWLAHFLGKVWARRSSPVLLNRFIGRWRKHPRVADVPDPEAPRWQLSAGFRRYAFVQAWTYLIAIGPIVTILLLVYVVLWPLIVLPQWLGQLDAKERIAELRHQASCAESTGRKPAPTFTTKEDGTYFLLECNDEWCIGMKGAFFAMPKDSITFVSAASAADARACGAAPKDR